MSTLLVRSIAHSFRRAGFAFSSASTTPLDLRTLTYDQVRALVFELQLEVTAEFDRGDGAQQQSGAELRNEFLAAETQLGREGARLAFADEMVDVAAPASALAAVLALEQAREVSARHRADVMASAVAARVAAADETPKPAPVPAPAKPPKGAKK